jgi:hypothetical protein
VSTKTFIKAYKAMQKAVVSLEDRMTNIINEATEEGIGPVELDFLLDIIQNEHNFRTNSFILDEKALTKVR